MRNATTRLIVRGVTVAVGLLGITLAQASPAAPLLANGIWYI